MSKITKYQTYDYISDIDESWFDGDDDMERSVDKLTSVYWNYGNMNQSDTRRIAIATLIGIITPRDALSILESKDLDEKYMLGCIKIKNDTISKVNMETRNLRYETNCYKGRIKSNIKW